jgi:large subunit ribosomal protein L7/L12
MRLFLIRAGERRINVIREIRSFTGSTLKDAKDMSEGTNVLLFDGPSRVGRRFEKALAAQGAVTEVKGNPNPIPRWLRNLADWIEG